MSFLILIIFVIQYRKSQEFLRIESFFRLKTIQQFNIKVKMRLWIICIELQLILIFFGSSQLLNYTQSGLYFPKLHLKFTYSKKIPSNFTDLVKYEVDGANVFQVYENGIFNHIYLTENETFQNTYFNISAQNSTLWNSTLIDYDYEGYALHFLISYYQSNQVCIIWPDSQKELRRINITEIEIQQNSLLQTTNESYYIINPGSQNQTAVIYKYFRQGKVNESKVIKNAKKYHMNATFSDFEPILQAFSGVKGEKIRAKVCRKWRQYDDFLVLWNESSYIEVWTCDYWECQQRWNVTNDIGNESWVAGDLNWGPDCNSLYVQYDGYQPAVAYNQWNGSIARNYTISQMVIDFKTIGSSFNSHGALLLANNTFLLLNPKGVFQQCYTDFGDVTMQSRYVQSSRRLLMNYELQSKVYKFQCWEMTYYNYWKGMCDDCSKTCDGCNEDNGKCLKCVKGLVVNVSNEKECINPNVTELYFPDIMLGHEFNRTVLTNFSNIFRYEVLGGDAFEFYLDGSFVHTDLDESRQRQNVYFNKTDNTSQYYNKVLVDFGFQTYKYNELHFLIDTGQIITYDGFYMKESKVFDLTEFEISNDSLLEVTNETFYVINPQNENQSAVIYRMFRKENNDLEKILLNAEQLGLNISKLIGTVVDTNQTDLNATDFNSTDLNATDFNSTDLNATDFNSTDLNATDFNSIDFNSTDSNSSSINSSTINPPPITFNFTFPATALPSNLTGRLWAKVCKQYYRFYQFLAIWNESSHMQVFRCDYWQCKLMWKTTNNMFNNTTIDVEWGSECWKMYLSAENYSEVVIYWALNGAISRHYSVGTQFITFRPSGWGCSYNTALFSNGSFNYVSNLTNYTFLHEKKDFANVTPLSRYLWNNRRHLLINAVDYIQMWQFKCQSMMYYDFQHGVCRNCSWTCDGCQENTGYCTACIKGYRPKPLDPMECIKLPVFSPAVAPEPVIKNPLINQSAHSTLTNTKDHILQVVVQNSTLNNSISNSGNMSIVDFKTLNNSISNSGNMSIVDFNQAPAETPNNNLSSTTSESENPPLKYGALYVYELATAEMTLKGFGVIGSLIKFIFLILQIAPLAWLFLNFMNFWNICSFYLFLNADIPQYLRMILKLIYDKINTTIPGIDTFSQRIYPLQQRLPQWSEQYGISSSFIIMNLQSLLFLTSSILITIFTIGFLNSLNHQNYLKKRFGPLINFKEIMTNQFISMASNFFFPLPLILYMINIYHYRQAPNMAFHVLLIGISLIFPFMIFGQAFEVSKNRKSAKFKNLLKKQTTVMVKKKKKVNKISQNTLQWIFYSNCNTLVPFLCLLGIPGIFYIFGLGFFTVGVWVAWKSQGCRINELILSLHPMIFHISFTIVAVFGHYSLPVKHHASMICAILLFIGALHQLLTAFFRIFYLIVTQILKLLKRIRDKEQQNIAKEQQKTENIFRNMREKKLRLKVRQTNGGEKESIAKKIRFKRKRTKLQNVLKCAQPFDYKHQSQSYQQTFIQQATQKNVKMTREIPQTSVFKRQTKSRTHHHDQFKQTDILTVHNVNHLQNPVRCETERRSIWLNHRKLKVLQKGKENRIIEDNDRIGGQFNADFF